MTKELFAVICVVLVLVLALLALWAWRRRGRRQSDVDDFATPPAEFDAVAEADIDYIATTRRDDPYDRVVVHGLAFRGPGRLIVGTDGMALELGERDRWIPRDSLQFVERATWTIDRVVESGGMLAIGTLAGTAAVDIYVRARTNDRVITDALRQLAAGSPNFLADRGDPAASHSSTTERSTSA